MGSLNTEVCVIGGVCVDTFATARKTIIPEDSNIGTTLQSFGGVGHNIACNLSKLGINVELICAFGNDDKGTQLIQHCQEEKIGLKYSLKSTKPTASYTSINKPNGDIYIAIADMEVNEDLTVEYLSKYMDFINSCKIVVLETNLRADSIKYLLENIKTKIFVDPVSQNKAIRLQGSLNSIKAIKPNLGEAEVLLESKGAPEELANDLIKQGILEVYLTLGEKGAIGVNKDKVIKKPVYLDKVINTTGCGDAFMAGIIYGELKGEDLTNKLNYGLSAATICARSIGSISEFLNEEEMKRVIRGNI